MEQLRTSKKHIVCILSDLHRIKNELLEKLQVVNTNIKQQNEMASSIDNEISDIMNNRARERVANITPISITFEDLNNIISGVKMPQCITFDHLLHVYFELSDSINNNSLNKKLQHHDIWKMKYDTIATIIRDIACRYCNTLNHAFLECPIKCHYCGTSNHNMKTRTKYCRQDPPDE